MQQTFLRTARKILTGPALTLSVLSVNTGAHPENKSPPVSAQSPSQTSLDIPIITIDLDDFHKRLETEQPALVQALRETIDPTPGFHELSVIYLESYLSSDKTGVAQGVRKILQDMSEASLIDRPIQTWIATRQSINLISTEDLARLLLQDTPSAQHLSLDNTKVTACMTFLRNDPELLWGQIKRDLGASDSVKLPQSFDGRSFVKDHEGAGHCEDPALLNVSSSNSSHDEKEVLNAEIHADMVSAELHKDNPVLLEEVARMRIMESVVSFMNTMTIDHNSAFELWRYLTDHDAKSTPHTYLAPEDMVGAYAEFYKICDPIMEDDDFSKIADKLRQESTSFEDRMFVDTYLATRLALEAGAFKDPSAKMIAEEYVSAFDSFDALYHTEIKTKTTTLVNEVISSSQEVTSPSQPPPIPSSSFPIKAQP